MKARDEIFEWNIGNIKFYTDKMDFEIVKYPSPDHSEWLRLKTDYLSRLVIGW